MLLFFSSLSVFFAIIYKIEQSYDAEFFSHFRIFYMYLCTCKCIFHFFYVSGSIPVFSETMWQCWFEEKVVFNFNNPTAVNRYFVCVFLCAYVCASSNVIDFLKFYIQLFFWKCKAFLFFSFAYKLFSGLQNSAIIIVLL